MRKLIPIFLFFTFLSPVLLAQNPVTNNVQGVSSEVKKAKSNVVKSNCLINEGSNINIIHKELLSNFPQFDWSVDNKSAKSIRYINKKILLKLLINTSKNGWYWEELEKIDESRTDFKPINELRIRDVNNDGYYEIIFTTGDECVLCPTAIYVIKNKDNKTTMYSFDTIYGSTRGVRDIDGDKVAEVFSSYLIVGIATVGSTGWTDVFVWDGENYIKNNEKFPEYFREMMARNCDRTLREYKYLTPNGFSNKFNDATSIQKSKSDWLCKLNACLALYNKAEKEVFHKPLPQKRIAENEIKRIEKFPDETIDKSVMKVKKPIEYVANVSCPVLKNTFIKENNSRTSP